MNRKFKIEDNMSFVELPGTDIFFITIAQKMGSDVEKLYEYITGIDVYGISHLIEHLSFKNTKEFTTKELIENLREFGSYNASTSKSNIRYYYNTVMQHKELAIDLVLNTAFNSLNKLNKEEFESEKEVVVNEIKTYQSNAIGIYNRMAFSLARGLNMDDNNLGNPDVVKNFTMKRVQEIKHYFINSDYLVHFTYDSEKISKDEVISLFNSRLERFNNIEDAPLEIPVLNDINKNYNDSISNYIFNINSSVDIELEQLGTKIIIEHDYRFNPFLIDFGNKYLSRLAKGTSLDYLVREINGLTYNISMGYSDHANNAIIISSDITKDKLDLYLSLVKEAIVKSVDEFTIEKHIDVKNRENVINTINNLDLTVEESYHYYFREYPEYTKDVILPMVSNNLVTGYNKLMKKEVTYKKLVEYFNYIKNKIVNKEYSLITSKK